MEREMMDAMVRAADEAIREGNDATPPLAEFVRSLANEVLVWRAHAADAERMLLDRHEPTDPALPAITLPPGAHPLQGAAEALLQDLEIDAGSDGYEEALDLALIHLQRIATLGRAQERAARPEMKAVEKLGVLSRIPADRELAPDDAPILAGFQVQATALAALVAHQDAEEIADAIDGACQELLTPLSRIAAELQRANDERARANDERDRIADAEFTRRRKLGL